MAASPQLKIFNPQGEYIGCVKHFEDAAILVSNYGDGAEVRMGHSKKDTIWREGSEEFPAAESFNGAREAMVSRLKRLGWIAA